MCVCLFKTLVGGAEGLAQMLTCLHPILELMGLSSGSASDPASC